MQDLYVIFVSLDGSFDNLKLFGPMDLTEYSILLSDGTINDVSVVKPTDLAFPDTKYNGLLYLHNGKYYKIFKIQCIHADKEGLKRKLFESKHYDRVNDIFTNSHIDYGGYGLVSTTK